MKLEVEMTAGQLNLLILSTEVYARALMNQPDLVADILAEDRFFYDKNDSENDKRFHEWIEARDEFTEKLRAALNIMFRDAYKSKAGLHAFTMSPTKWIEGVGAIGIVSKAGRYGGTYAHYYAGYYEG